MSKDLKKSDRCLPGFLSFFPWISSLRVSTLQCTCRVINFVNAIFMQVYMRDKDGVRWSLLELPYGKNIFFQLQIKEL